MHARGLTLLFCVGLIGLFVPSCARGETQTSPTGEALLNVDSSPGPTETSQLGETTQPASQPQGSPTRQDRTESAAPTKVSHARPLRANETSLEAANKWWPYGSLLNCDNPTNDLAVIAGSGSKNMEETDPRKVSHSKVEILCAPSSIDLSKATVAQILAAGGSRVIHWYIQPGDIKQYAENPPGEDKRVTARGREGRMSQESPDNPRQQVETWKVHGDRYLQYVMLESRTASGGELQIEIDVDPRKYSVEAHVAFVNSLEEYGS